MVKMKFYVKSITLQPDLLMQTDLLLLFFDGWTKKRRAFKKQFRLSNFNLISCIGVITQATPPDGNGQVNNLISFKNNRSLCANYLLLHINSYYLMVNCTLPDVFVRQERKHMWKNLTYSRNRPKQTSGVSSDVFSVSTDEGLKTQYDLSKK